MNEKSQFQEKFVLYMDILGTKSLIQTQPDELLEVIKNIASNNRKGEIINKMASDGIMDNVKFEAEISSFSDHILVSLTDTPVTLLCLIHIAIQIHSFILAQGMLVRGAITKGSLYHDGNIALGKALIKAAHLEEEKSNYPRVIIDNEIIYLFKDHLKAGSIVRDKKDSQYYVNYISSSLILGVSEHEIIINSDRVKKAIENKVFDNNLNRKARSKWLWLAEKFNEFLDNPEKQKKYPKIKDIQAINLQHGFLWKLKNIWLHRNK